MTSIAHVPMALSVQGSTLMTVAQSLIDAARSFGVENSAVLSDNRGVALKDARLTYVDYMRDCPREWFARGELARDVAAGAAGFVRPCYGRMYDVAIEALTRDPADIVLLYAASVACFPSLCPEGLPLVALEAMACGAPVVTSDSAGMVEAAESDGLWRARSVASRARAATFTWEKALSQLKGLA